MSGRYDKRQKFNYLYNLIYQAMVSTLVRVIIGYAHVRYSVMSAFDAVGRFHQWSGLHKVSTQEQIPMMSWCLAANLRFVHLSFPRHLQVVRFSPPQQSRALFSFLTTNSCGRFSSLVVCRNFCKYSRSWCQNHWRLHVVSNHLHPHISALGKKEGLIQIPCRWSEEK